MLNSKPLHFASSGTGDRRLLFIHGLGGSNKIWHKQIEKFSAHYEVVAIDCLGHGKSPSVSAVDFYRSSYESVIQLIAQLPSKPTTVIGHSIAGELINRLIGKSPILDSFIFVDSPCLLSPEKLFTYRQWSEEIRKSPKPDERILNWFSSFLTEQGSAEDHALTLKELRKISAEWLCDFMEQVPKPVSAASDAVMLVIEGTQYFTDDSLSWSRMYPRAQKRTILKPGHFYFLENPDAFDQVLAAFLTGLLKQKS